MLASNIRRQAHVPVVAGAVAATLGALALIGWAVGSRMLVSVVPGLSTTKPNTGLCLLLLGAALATRGRVKSLACTLLASVAAVVAGLTLVEGITGADLGLDTLLFGAEQGRGLEPTFEPIGRMAAGTSVCLLLVAVGLLLLRRRPRAATGCAMVVAAAGYLVLVSYAYGSSSVRSASVFSSTALPTAAGVLALGLGVVWSRPHAGLLGLARDRGPLGRFVRRLCVFALVVPPVAGGLRLVGRNVGAYDETFGVAVTIVAWTIGLLLVIWWSGSRAVERERARTEAMAATQAAQQRLGLAVESSILFGSAIEVVDVLELVTTRVADTLLDACVIHLTDESAPGGASSVLHHVDPSRETKLEAALGRGGMIGPALVPLVPTPGDPVVASRLHNAGLEQFDPAAREAVAQAGLRSVIVAPLVWRGRSLGMIAAVRDQTWASYDDDDLGLLLDIADRAAQTIFHADQVTRKLRADQALSGLGRLGLTVDDGDRFVEAALKTLVDALGAADAMYLAGSDDDQSMVVEALAHREGDPIRIAVGDTVATGIPLTVWRSGEPTVCDDMRHHDDAGMVHLAELLDTDSGMAVVVPAAQGGRGVLCTAGVGVGRYTRDDLHFLSAYAGVLASALDRFDYLHELTELTELADRRQSLLGRLRRVEEEERSRLAGEVHDDQAQAMASLALRLETLRTRVLDTAPELVDEVELTQASVEAASQRLDHLLLDLRSPTPEVALATAVRRVADHVFRDSPGTAVRIEVHAGQALREGLGMAAFRIVKEALTNAAKHARATEVEVCVDRGTESLEISISDDGDGMEPESMRDEPGQRGLRSMRDEAELAGGELRLESRPGQGTLVFLALPIAAG